MVCLSERLNSVEGVLVVKGGDELFNAEFAVTVLVKFGENLSERRQLNAGLNCEVVVCLGLSLTEIVVTVGVEFSILEGCADFLHGVLAHDTCDNLFLA